MALTKTQIKGRAYCKDRHQAVSNRFKGTAATTANPNWDHHQENKGKWEIPIIRITDRKTTNSDKDLRPQHLEDQQTSHITPWMGLLSSAHRKLSTPFSILSHSWVVANPTASNEARQLKSQEVVSIVKWEIRVHTTRSKILDLMPSSLVELASMLSLKHMMIPSVVLNKYNRILENAAPVEESSMIKPTRNMHQFASKFSFRNVRNSTHKHRELWHLNKRRRSKRLTERQSKQREDHSTQGRFRQVSKRIITNGSYSRCSCGWPCKLVDRMPCRWRRSRLPLLDWEQVVDCQARIRENNLVARGDSHSRGEVEQVVLKSSKSPSTNNSQCIQLKKWPNSNNSKPPWTPVYNANTVAGSSMKKPPIDTYLYVVKSISRCICRIEWDDEYNKVRIKMWF